MKNKSKNIILFTIIIILVFFVSLIALKNNKKQPLVIDAPYNFPIRPGTEEWKAFNDHVEMLKATTIPPNVLKTISTNSLISTVLDYPLLFDMFAYNNIQMGFNAVRNSFNGLQELMIRVDAQQKLFEKYSTINPEEYPTENKMISSKEILGIILSQKEIYDKLSEEQKNTINNIGIIKLIPGLKIININQNSPLNKVSLVNLNNSQDYEDDHLFVDDIITGISIDYEKTNFDDIIKRERPSEYFIPINSEKELYTQISKLKTDKLILGVVRKIPAGNGYYDKPDLAIISFDLHKMKDLGVELLPNK